VSEAHNIDGEALRLQLNVAAAALGHATLAVRAERREEGLAHIRRALRAVHVLQDSVHPSSLRFGADG
jgi:hypothetical protein